MIEAINLTKNYYLGQTELKVLKGISFKIAKGEFAAITGRSGAGKSTVLYQLGLLDNPSYGKVILDGFDMGDLSDQARTSFRLEFLGYVFQDYALLPELTALENVVLPLIMLGIPDVEAYKKARLALEKVELGDKFEYLPSRLSGGQQQRVSIARAIANEPKILFADEPTANLDSKTAVTIMEVFGQLNKDGQTIVMVTHEDEQIKQITRRLVLSDGLIIKDEKFN